MPAIDPARLSREAGELAELLGDVAALRRRCKQLLEFYTDRTRHPGGARPGEGAVWSFNAPRPVVRAVSQTLYVAASGRPELAWPAALGLWEAGYREMQIIAASILSCFEGEEVAAWAEERAVGVQDMLTLAELAGTAMAGWRRAAPEAFLTRAGLWIGEESRRLRAFGLMALAAAVQDPMFEDLPSVLRLMPGVARSVRGIQRRALMALVCAMARRSPPETARFLLDEVEEGENGARRLALEVLECFPSRQRSILRHALLG